MNILHIDCSPRRDSHSRQLSSAVVDKLLSILPDARISRRDLGYEPIPHAGADYAATLATPASLAAAGRSADALVLAEQLIGEVERADVVVIGTPMNNFTVPSVMKAWIDQILRVGARCSRHQPARSECFRTVPCSSRSLRVACLLVSEPISRISSRPISPQYSAALVSIQSITCLCKGPRLSMTFAQTNFAARSSRRSNRRWSALCKASLEQASSRQLIRNVRPCASQSWKSSRRQPSAYAGAILVLVIARLRSGASVSRVWMPFACCPVSRYAAGIRYFVRVSIDRKCRSIAIA